MKEKQSLGAKTLALPAPVWVICTYDLNGKANAMTASWAGICCSNPPCLSVSLRKATYSYDAIVNRKAFTVNIPSAEYMAATDYFGVASGRKDDKFARTKLTPIASQLVDAPYIGEFPIVIECSLLHTFEIGLHTIFVGEILDVKGDSTILNDQKLPDIEKIKTFVFNPGTRTYHAVSGQLAKGFDIGHEFS